MIDAKYFKAYRTQLGFTNQQHTKIFLAAKDITPAVDFVYIEQLNHRLMEIIRRTNTIVSDEIKINDLKAFEKERVTEVFNILKKHHIIERLNNQGRRPE